MQDSLAQLGQSLMAYVPRLIGVVLVLVVAWIIARVVRSLTHRGLEAARLDQRARSEGLAATVADLAYYLVFLLALPMVLGILELQGLLVPVEQMITRLLAFLPNLLGAAVILIVGLFVARIVRQLVTNVLAAVGVDRLGQRVGMAADGLTVSGLLGTIVYILILVPTLTAALDALGLQAITQPISNMLNQFLAALPGIFGAAILLVLAYAIGRVLAGLVTSLLASAGVDSIPARLGLTATTAPAGRSLSSIVGTLIFVAIMLFSTIEALRLLGFSSLALLVTQFMVLAGQVIMGLIIFAIGLYLGNMAYGMVRSSAMNSADILAPLARGAILVLAGAMALRQMGLANEIVNLAFGLFLGAIAVAAAIAFGLGGRETAARVLEDWRADRLGSPTNGAPAQPGAPRARPAGD
jgi:hypothetical protein